MGYLIGKPDGYYGAGTQRSVRLLQYYNGLEQNGLADVALQKLVFSGQAKVPDHPMLADGASGQEVTKLQQRLHVLGFMVSLPDGTYGPATESAVENLQQYFQAQEKRGTDRRGDGKRHRCHRHQDRRQPAGHRDQRRRGTQSCWTSSTPPLSRTSPGALSSGSSGEEVKRVQRRLYGLEYLYTSADGGYGAGTANAIKDFQKRNKLSQTGQADQKTLEALFSDMAKKALKPYVLKVSIAKQRVYAYAPDANEEYTVLVRTMKCSTGMPATPTPKGTYQASTAPTRNGTTSRSSSSGHSTPTPSRGTSCSTRCCSTRRAARPLTAPSTIWAGRPPTAASASRWENAKWIYQNCPPKTKVIIY